MDRSSILKETANVLKKWKPTSDHFNNNDIFEISSSKTEQNVYIQLTPEEDIWVRLNEGYSAYYCESIDELNQVINDFLSQKIKFAIGFKGEKWKETTLVYKDVYDDLSPKLRYLILGWEMEARKIPKYKPINKIKTKT